MMKYKAVCVNGNFKGREGYTLTKKANELGIIMWYSKEGKYPYRSALLVEDIKFI